MTKQSDMAEKILTSIEANHKWFNMDEFVYFDDDAQIVTPNEPICGTTLCVAGFAAYLSGWTTSRTGSSRIGSYCVKGALEDRISNVASEALDIGIVGPELYFTNEDIALAVLKRMAAGEVYTDQMVRDERETWYKTK